MKVPANLSEALRLARSLGWEVRPSRDGWKLRHPDGGATMLHRHSAVRADWHSMRNFVADLRRTDRRPAP